MPFSPSSLSGKTLWLRAKDLGSGGSSVTSWADQSGCANDSLSQTSTAPTVNATGTPASGKSVSFTGNGYLTFPTVQAVYHADASSYFDQSNRWAGRAFDGSTSTVWSSATSTGWLRVRRADSTTFVVNSYDISAGSSQYPKTWTFEGSSDGSSWTTLDTRTNITSGWGGSPVNFTFSNSTAYKYYRLNVTANDGSANLTINELTLNTISPKTVVELWMVIKSGGNTYNPYRMGSSQDDLRYPFSDGKWYDDGCGTTRVSFTPSSTLTSWRLIRVIQRNPGREWYVDGTSSFSDSGVWGANDGLRIGNGGSGSFTGEIAEVLVRNVESSSGEIADLITYFNTEHGMSVPGGSTPPTVAAPLITASSDMLDPSVTTTTVVAAPLLTANSDMLDPTVTATSGATTVAAPLLVGSSDMLDPTVSIVSNVDIAAPVLTATSDMLDPAITIASSVAIAAPTLTTSSAMLSPLVLTESADGAESYTNASDDVVDPLVLEWEQLESYTDAWATAFETLTVAVDPVTLRPGYSLKVVDMQGGVLCELTEAAIDTATRTLNGRGGVSFTLPKLSDEVAMVQQFSEVQLWRGGHLVPGGWYVVKDAGIEVDEHVVGFQCPGLSYYFERRIIGGDRPELLLNGGFEQGSRYWNFGWSPGGSSGRPPNHLLTRDACEGGKALVVYGDSDNHRQFAWQGFTYTNTNPTEPLWIDIQAQCRIDDYDGPAKDEWMLYADVRPSAGSATILFADSVRIDETNPRDVWIPMSVRVKIAPSTTSWVQVRLYPPHGSASFDQVSAKADTALTIRKRDPWQAMQELVEESQNVANGKSDLNIYTYGSWSGFKIDRTYQWKDRTRVSEAMDEIVRSRNGPDANMEVGARIRRLTVAPKQGARIGFLKPVFAVGDRAGDARIVSYSAGVDGDEVATTAVVQSSWSGGGMSEVIVTSPRDDGLVLEKLYQADQDIPTSTLLEQGLTAVKYGRADVITRIVMHPDDTTSLLQQGITIGAVVTLDIHDGEVDVRADYRIVQIDVDPNRDQLSYSVVPEV